MIKARFLKKLFAGILSREKTSHYFFHFIFIWSSFNLHFIFISPSSHIHLIFISRSSHPHLTFISSWNQKQCKKLDSLGNMFPEKSLHHFFPSTLNSLSSHTEIKTQWDKLGFWKANCFKTKLHITSFIAPPSHLHCLFMSSSSHFHLIFIPSSSHFHLIPIWSSSHVHLMLKSKKCESSKINSNYFFHLNFILKSKNAQSSFKGKNSVHYFFHFIFI